jgi:hypothetical protein
MGIGTVSRTGIPGLFIGNTAEKILYRVDCSVLAVKTDGEIDSCSIFIVLSLASVLPDYWDMKPNSHFYLLF